MADSAAGITCQEFAARLARCRQAMGQARLDALVAYANKMHPGHVRYLTGYEPRLGIHDSAVCVVTGHGCTLVTNAGFDRPHLLTWLDDVVITADYAAAIGRLLPHTASEVGIAGLPALPAPVYIGLLQQRPQLNIRDASDLLLSLRRIKSPQEVELLRRCAQITDAGGKAFFETALPGAMEREILVRVEAALKLAGSDEVSFSTQVCSGQRTSQVVAFAGDEKLSDDTIVQLDCGGTFAGYRGDLSRVKLLGRPHPRLCQFAEVAAEIYHRCLELMRPGVPCAEMARRAVDIARAHGLEEFLYRSPNHEAGFVGHGIGLSYFEPPELNPQCDIVLEENMVIVLEPIVADPALGGVKLEDAVLIAAAGPERLSELPVT